MFSFLLCLKASETVILKAKAKFILHLKGVCLLQEGRLLEEGKETGPPTSPTQHHGSSASEAATATIRFLHNEAADKPQSKALLSLAKFRTVGQ